MVKRMIWNSFLFGGIFLPLSIFGLASEGLQPEFVFKSASVSGLIIVILDMVTRFNLRRASRRSHGNIAIVPIFGWILVAMTVVLSTAQLIEVHTAVSLGLLGLLQASVFILVTACTIYLLLFKLDDVKPREYITGKQRYDRHKVVTSETGWQ